MMRTFIPGLLLFLSVLCMPFYLQAQQEPIWMPQPNQVRLSAGQLRLDTSFTYSLEGQYHPRLQSGIQRFADRLGAVTTIRLPLQRQTATGRATLRIITERSAKLELGEDETYELIVTASSISLKATTDLGALRGLETLIQALQYDESGYYLQAMRIVDGPRFPWRGLMLDACRHFMPEETVRAVLDAMAAVKLNVFHWHLSEDQGFRVESKVYPGLHESGSDGLYYTQEQIRALIRYADDRGIRVVPEFDMPGHTTAWMPGYPHLASAPGPYGIERFFGVFDPTMDPSKPETYIFLDSFLTEMCGLFPDRYFHIGGDENNGKQWNENPQIQAFMRKEGIPDNHSLQAYFNRKVQAMLQRNGKVMMGWDEILDEQLPVGTVIQSWRGKEFLSKAAQKGFYTVLSNGYYIDLSHTAVQHYLNDPLPATAAMAPEERKYVLGGEATMWAELVTQENVESRIWPRTAAIAERFWSAEQLRDTVDMYRRLLSAEFYLEAAGSRHLVFRDKMIRRLAGDGSGAQGLRIWLDWMRPLDGYRRHGTPPRYHSAVPLTRAVDAAVPDPPAATRALIAWRSWRRTGDKAHLDDLRGLIWQAIYVQALVEQLTESRPALRELEPHIAPFRNIALLTEEFLEIAAAGTTVKAEKIQMTRHKLTGLRCTKAEMENAMLPLLEEMLQYVQVAK